MKKTAICLAFCLVSCATQGTYQRSYDEFTNENRTSISIGQLSLKRSYGLFSTVRASFEEVKNGKGVKSYYLNFTVYGESFDRKCPNVKKGSKIIFLLEGKPFEHKTVSAPRKNKNSIGLLTGGCTEDNILVGPLTKDFIAGMLKANSLRFKIYGENAEIEGSILDEEINEIRKFLSQ